MTRHRGLYNSPPSFYTRATAAHFARARIEASIIPRFRRCIRRFPFAGSEIIMRAVCISRNTREADSTRVSYTRTFTTRRREGGRRVRKVERENVRERPVFSRKGPFLPFVSPIPSPHTSMLSPASLFLPSFLLTLFPLTAVWCDMRPRGVYFLWLLHAHSIILYSFLHLTARISLFFFLSFIPPPASDSSPSYSPYILCLRHITPRMQV